MFLARGLKPAPDDDEFEPEHEELDDAPSSASRCPRRCAGCSPAGITNASTVAGILAAIHGRATGWRDLRPADAPWPPGRVD